jgi:large subunit ribosomal protein L2
LYGLVTRIEYDPNRNALLALVVYPNGLSTYIIATNAMKVGTRIIAADVAPISEGNAIRLANIPAGIRISCIETIPNRGAQYIRAAGVYAKIITKTNKYAVIQLKSGVTRRVLLQCMATIGSISNFSYMFKKFNRAGVSRHLG